MDCRCIKRGGWKGLSWELTVDRLLLEMYGAISGEVWEDV